MCYETQRPIFRGVHCVLRTGRQESASSYSKRSLSILGDKVARSEGNDTWAKSREKSDDSVVALEAGESPVSKGDHENENNEVRTTVYGVRRQPARGRRRRDSRPSCVDGSAGTEADIPSENPGAETRGQVCTTEKITDRGGSKSRVFLGKPQVDKPKSAKTAAQLRKSG